MSSELDSELNSELNSQTPENRTVRIGEISGVHGVKGWVKIYSETAPKEKIFEYSPWFVSKTLDQDDANYEIVEWRNSGKTLIAQLKKVGSSELIEDRDQAVALMGSVIKTGVDQFEALDEGEYYWFQLQGLQVNSLYEGKTQNLGKVEKLMETGANDVLVVRSEHGQERLVPWTPGQHILRVDLQAGEIDVDWDPDF